MKHVTIKDVAKALNVSISTVSRAFNNKYDINPKTRELVLQKAEELGYSPNPIARKLIQKRSYNIGIVVPEFTNSFFPKVIIGAQEVLLEKGYQVLIMQSDESSQTEIKNVKTLVNNMVDGLIVSLCSENENIAYYQTLLSSKIPIVFFNRVVEEINASKVVFDDYKWALFATEHLIKQGYSKILHLAGSKSLSLTKNRIKGFKDAHKKYRNNHGKVIHCGFKMEDGEQIAQKLMSAGDIPEAIFAASDPCAIGVMKTFKKNGYRIPEDIAISGFSESDISQHVSPPLTSVEQPTHLIGQTAANLLIEQIETNGLFVPQTITLNGTLNIRESSVNLNLSV